MFLLDTELAEFWNIMICQRKLSNVDGNKHTYMYMKPYIRSGFLLLIKYIFVYLCFYKINSDTKENNSYYINILARD